MEEEKSLRETEPGVIEEQAFPVEQRPLRILLERVRRDADRVLPECREVEAVSKLRPWKREPRREEEQMEPELVAGSLRRGAVSDFAEEEFHAEGGAELRLAVSE